MGVRPKDSPTKQKNNSFLQFSFYPAIGALHKTNSIHIVTQLNIQNVLKATGKTQFLD